MPTDQKERTQCPADVRVLCDAARSVVKKRLDLGDEVEIYPVTNGTRWAIRLERKWGAEPEQRHRCSKPGVAEVLAEWSPYEEAEILDWLERALSKNSEKRDEEPKKEPKKPTAGSYAEWAGGYYRMPNVLVDTGLLGAMPLPVLRAYITCYRYVGVDGSFYISHAALAEKIGCRNRTKGADAMKRLVSAGLVKIERRGNSSGRATDYRLVALNEDAIERARKIFNVYPVQGTGVPRGRVHTVPRAGDTLQTSNQDRSARSKRARSRNEKCAPSALSKSSR